MTKSKILRFIELCEVCVTREAAEEKGALWREFQAWHPDEEAAQMQQGYLAMNRSWDVKCDALRRERDRLRHQLAYYAEHKGHCSLAYREGTTCNCGLDEALNDFLPEGFKCETAAGRLPVPGRVPATAKGEPKMSTESEIAINESRADMTDANVYHLWEFSDIETNQVVGLLDLEVVRHQAVERHCLPLVEKLVEALKAGGTIRCQYSKSETEPRPHP